MMTHPSAESTVKRRLVVPIGGTGWGWGLLARFMVLFSGPQLLAHIPLSQATRWVSFAYGGLSSSVAERFPLFPSPEADQRLYMHLVPLVLAAIWLLLDRKRKHDVLIHEVGRLCARYAIALILSSYALEKTFGAQGSATYISYGGMLPPYGVGTRGFNVFLWLGQSVIYENFAALVEILPLLLIPFRRAEPWGSLIALAACVNVFIVNTGHWNNGLSLTPIAMVASPICLVLPYAKRYLQFFTSRSVESAAVGYLTPPSWYWFAAAPVKAFVIAWGFYSHNHFSFTVGPHGQISALSGLYHVTAFTRNGKVEPMAAEFPNRWVDVSIGLYGQDLNAETVDYERKEYTFELPRTTFTSRRAEIGIAEWARKTSSAEGDLPVRPAGSTGLEHGTLIVGGKAMFRALKDFNAGKKYTPPPLGNFHYVHSTPDDLTISGVAGNDTIVAQMRRMHLDSLPLYHDRWYPERWRYNIAMWFRDHGVIYPY